MCEASENNKQCHTFTEIQIISISIANESGYAADH